MNVTIRQIRYFVATAEAGQVSRAAEICNITQSSITLAINRLEDELGQKLFVRQSRGMLLTAQGEDFLRHCHAILQTLDDAMELCPAVPSDLTATIRVGMTGTIAGYVFPPFWRKFKREFPRITLAVVEAEYAELEKALLADELDMVMMLISNIRRSDACTYEKLLESPRRLWLANSNPLANKERISLADLKDQDYIVPTMDAHEGMIERYWVANGFEPKVLFRSYALEALRSMVGNDLGVSILSDMVYRSFSLEGRRIVRRDLVEPPPSSDVGIAWRKDEALSVAGKTFLSMLRSETSGL
uniref:LysR family transcriptional regulator n=1 Tax=Roseovarius indicus TaxID=540747 RepID=UPI003B52F05E